MAKNRESYSLSQLSWQDLYYDGYVEYFDERNVSSYMTEGLGDCIEYIENSFFDDEVLWLKNEAQKKYYREPFSNQQLMKI